MGTIAQLVLYAPDKQHALEASNAAFERMSALDDAQ
jgi:hypothetical protein